MEQILTVIAVSIITPALTFFTLWLRNSSAKDARVYKRDEEYLGSLTDRIAACEKQLAQRDIEIREIKVELKNRDEEYLKLFQEYTSLKAKYDVLKTDHEQLKSDYDATVAELSIVKDDIKQRAEVAITTVQKL